MFTDGYRETSLTTPSGAFRPELSNDGVHPNSDGYAAMRSIADAALRKAIQEALKIARFEPGTYEGLALRF